MVRKFIKYFTIAMLFPFLSFAEKFSANVDRNQIGMGENFVLELKLSDASPKNSPDISELKKVFNLMGLQQSSRTMIMNGQVSTSTSWHYTLTPKKIGTQTIPEMSIESSEGKVTSKPITISVEKASQLPSTDASHDVTITAQISKPNPYKNEPIVYTVKLTSPQNLADLKLGDLSVENAVVEAYGKPKVSESVESGIAVKVVEVKYIITPLKSGSLTIPSFVMQGAVLVQGKSSLDPFSSDDLDAFGLLGKLGSLSPFDEGRLEPFSVASDPISLEIQKPIQGISPWLPATSLKITENWNNAQTPKVGEPLTRTFTIVAEGVTKSQLPSLKAQQSKGNDFKVYGDKPSTEESLKNNRVASWRQEGYTLIPQQSGTLTLPEISIPWWNVKEGKIEYAKIPQRIVYVAPIPQDNSQNSQITQSNPQEKVNLPDAPSSAQSPPPTTQAVSESKQSNWMFYGVSSALLILLILTVIVIVRLLRRKAKVERKNIHSSKDRIREEPKLEILPLNNKKIEDIKTAEELYRYLQSYASQHWGASQNVSLDTLFSTLKKQRPDLEQKYIDALLIPLQDTLYADKKIDLEEIKKCLMDILITNKKGRKEKSKEKDRLPDLNPQ